MLSRKPLGRAGSLWRLIVRLAVFKALVCVCLVSGARLSAQDTAVGNWEVMPVLIPADPELQRQHIPRTYIPIERGDLNRKLLEEQQRRRKEQFLTPELLSAFYLAKIDNGLLIVDRGRWHLRGGPESKPLNLGKVSVAMRDAQAADGTPLEQLSRHQSFLADGSIELNVTDADAKLWLGFTCSSAVDEVGEYYSIRLPAAAIGTLLVSSRRHERVFSDDVVIEEVQRPSDYFPSDWPRGSVREAALANNRRWWLINLSGCYQFRLRVDRALEAEHLLYRHSLRQTELDYLIGSRQLEVRAMWQLAASYRGAPMTIRLADSLRIKNILVNGLAVDWQGIQEAPSGENWVEIVDLPRLEPGALVQLTAVAAHPGASEFDLPMVQLARSWSIQGGSRVRGSGSLAIQSVECAGVSCAPEIDSSDRGSQAELAWSHQWAGVAPPMQVRLSEQKWQWRADVLNRINVQSGWISANSRMLLSSNQLRSNELRLRVDPEWFIDSVQLLNEAEVDYRVQLLENNAKGELRSEIVISWEQERSTIQLELEVAAHRPRDEEQDVVQLTHPHVVSLVGVGQSLVEQTNTYVVESSGRFRVQPSAPLLRFQRLPRQLPEWQQALLPQLSDAWIFVDRYRSMPAIHLAASAGTYAIDLYTLLVEADTDQQSSSIVYRVTCRPVSGSVDRLRLHVPASVPLADLSFELLEALDDSVVPLAFEEVEAYETYRELQVYLPTQRSSPCHIRGRLVSPVGAVVTQVATLAFPDATSIQSTLLLPEGRASFVGRPTLELLPATACCSSEEVWLFEEELRGAAAEKFAAARLDGSAVGVLHLNRHVQSSSPGWVWSSIIDRYRWDDGSNKYFVHWSIQTTGSSDLKFWLPKGWRLDRIRVNGEAADEALVNVVGTDESVSHSMGSIPQDARQFQIPLPTNRRVNVHLECSVDPKLGWGTVIDKLVLERPHIQDVPVFDAAYRLHLSPSSVPLSRAWTHALGGRLIDRLLPVAWWSLLAPHANQLTREVVAEEQPNGWSVIDWPVDQSEWGLGTTHAYGASSAWSGRLWVVRRSALAACLTSLLLFLTTLLWLLLCVSTRAWWAFTSLSLVACVLLPREWAAWGQLLLLASGLAVLLRLVTWIGWARRAAVKTQDGRQLARRSSLVGFGGCLLLALISPETHVLAQSTRTSTAGLQVVPGATPGQADAGGKTMETPGEGQPANLYGILFPVDQDYKHAGAYAYVHIRLWELLSGNRQTGFSSRPPRLLSAAYLLRLRPGSVNAELAVDLLIQATREGDELRLPFRADQLQLVGGQINAEERLVGLPGLRQEFEHVVIQASKLGTFPVTLQFVTVNTDSSKRLKAALPSVPNATLRIESDGLQVDVNAVGGVQRSGDGELLANLGPVSELDVRWRDVSPRTFSPSGELASETWIHARGERLMAACQLRFSPRQTLRPLLHVYIDSDWEPVGTNWGDAELVTNETMSFGNRRVYTVRMSRVAGPSVGSGNNAQPDEQPPVIRVLLVPANQATLNVINVPFMLLQEQSATSRALAWSTSPEFSPWKADGVDFWQESFDSASDWGELTLARQRRNFKVPMGTSPLQVRRQNQGATPTIEERTVLRYSLAEVAVDYTARFEVNGAALRLSLPEQCRVNSVSVNGQSVEFWTSHHPSEQRLLVSTSGLRNSDVNVLELKGSLPATLNQDSALPRVVMHDFTVGSSRMLIYRSATLEFQFAEANYGELKRREISTPASLLLESLEVMVGEFEFGNEYRDRPLLPFAATIGEATWASPEYAMLLLNQAADGWIANVVAVWNPQAALDFAFFDVPSSTRNSLQTVSVARKFIPAADTSRATLCIVPSTTSKGQRVVRFSFPVPNAGTGQLLGLPQVHLLGKENRPLLLALPRRVDGATVQWTKAGSRIESDFLERIAEPGLNDYHLFAAVPTRTQIGWEPMEAETLKPLVIHRFVRILEVSEQSTRGAVGFWLQPRGELEFVVDLPDACQVLGVDLGGASASWWQVSERTVSVSIKPNYLPVHMQLLLEWKHPNDGEVGELQLPVPVAELASEQWLVSMVGKSRWRLKAPQGQPELSKARPEAALNAWLELMQETLQSQAGKGTEVQLWMLNWEPRQVGIANDMVINRNENALLDMNFDVDADGAVTVAEFWAGIGGTSIKLDWDPALVVPSDEVTYLLTENRLMMTSTALRESLVPRVAAAVLLALACLLAFVVARRMQQQYLTVLSVHPWGLWLQLGLLMLVLLPVRWPGVFVLGLACSLGISQWFANRVRPRRVAV
jgi:hypothetical protein